VLSLHRIEICAILAYFLSKFGCHDNCLGSLEILDTIFEFVDPEPLNFVKSKNNNKKQQTFPIYMPM